MAARIFSPENRLADALNTIEGATTAELVKAAENRVAQMRKAVRGFVDEKVREIIAFTEQGEEVLFAECRTLGRNATNVAEVAGAAGMASIGEIARGISAMVDSLLTSGVWHTDALRLHLDALALMNQTGDDGGATTVLERLRGMREAIGVSE